MRKVALAQAVLRAHPIIDSQLVSPAFRLHHLCSASWSPHGHRNVGRARLNRVTVRRA